MNSPKAIAKMMNERAIVFFVTDGFNTFGGRMPKIRNGTNVAASRRLDSEADISIDRSNTGIRKELNAQCKTNCKKHHAYKGKRYHEIFL